MSELFSIVSATVGHGAIGLDGKLGYREPVGDDVLIPTAAPGSEFISAHAPSEVRIRVAAPAAIHGALNYSARIDDGNPVAFAVDGHTIGFASRPCDVTAAVRLDPGNHVLAAWHRGPNHGYRHAIWALRPDDVAQSESGEATPENTAFVTIGCYATWQAYDALSVLLRTARRRGIAVHTFGVSEPYRNHTDAKIHRLWDWINGLPACFTHALYVDGRDTAFASSPEDICAAFNSFESPIVMGTERVAWPCREPSWLANFTGDREVARPYPQAGVFMGERGQLLDALEKLVELWAVMGKVSPDPEVADLWRLRHLRGEDQWLWQAGMIKQRINVALDTDQRLVANASYEADRIKKDGRFALNDRGGVPPIIHFPGGLFESWRDQAIGYFQLI